MIWLKRLGVWFLIAYLIFAVIYTDSFTDDNAGWDLLIPNLLIVYVLFCLLFATAPPPPPTLKEREVMALEKIARNLDK